MLLHFVSSMHTALTSGGAVHNEIQSPVSPSSQPNFIGAANIVLPCAPIHDQLGLLHTLHACIRLPLWLVIVRMRACLPWPAWVLVNFPSFYYLTPPSFSWSWARTFPNHFPSPWVILGWMQWMETLRRRFFQWQVGKYPPFWRPYVSTTTGPLPLGIPGGHKK